MSPPVLVFLVILPSASFHRIKAHSLPHIQLFLQLRPCDKLVLLPKTYKIHPSSNFSIRTLQLCFGAKRRGYNQFGGSITSNVNLSPTPSPNIKILFSVILVLELKLDCLRWSLGTLPLCYTIYMSTKLYR